MRIHSIVSVGAMVAALGMSVSVLAQSPAINPEDAEHARAQQERQRTQPLNNAPVWRDVRYGEAVTIEIGLPDADVDAFRAWLADATAGTAAFELGGEAYGDG